MKYLKKVNGKFKYVDDIDQGTLVDTPEGKRVLSVPNELAEIVKANELEYDKENFLLQPTLVAKSRLTDLVAERPDLRQYVKVDPKYAKGAKGIKTAAGIAKSIAKAPGEIFDPRKQVKAVKQLKKRGLKGIGEDIKSTWDLLKKKFK